MNLWKIKFIQLRVSIAKRPSDASGYPFHVNKLKPLNRSSTPSTINGTFAKIHFSRWHAVFAFTVKQERCRGVTLQTLYFEGSNNIGNQRYVSHC